MARTDVRGYEVYGKALCFRPLGADCGSLVLHGPSLALVFYTVLWRGQRLTKTYEAPDTRHEPPRNFALEN